MRPYDILKKVPLFSQVDPQGLAYISRYCRIETYSAYKVILREGDYANQLFILLDGKVDIVKNLGKANEVKVRSLSKPEYFGEMALIGRQVRTASVVTNTEVRLVCVDGLNLEKSLKKHPDISIVMLRTMIKRFYNLESGMLNTLDRFLPICSGCKKIRDGDNEWVSIEKYISQNTTSKFSHSICPSCRDSLYPDLNIVTLK